MQQNSLRIGQQQQKAEIINWSEKNKVVMKEHKKILIFFCAVWLDKVCRPPTPTTNRRSAQTLGERKNDNQYQLRMARHSADHTSSPRNHHSSHHIRKIDWGETILLIGKGTMNSSF